MKNILIFDDEILNTFKGFKKELEPIRTKPQTDFGIALQYGIKVLDCTKKEKKFIRYMFHKKRRIQKKWDKIYNDRYREINTPPFYMQRACV